MNRLLSNVDKTHIYWLQKALTLAEERRGFCTPNPAVGAVLVKDQQLLATGTHWMSGAAHAEAVAIQQAPLTQGATLYVTLEPCCHRNKKTPPCTELIIQSGITQVIYGFSDPNPAVNGQGAMRLHAAGIPCLHYALPEIDVFYRSYQFWWEHRRPFVTAKLAISLDGKIAGPEGKRVQLTSQKANQFTHQQRRCTDAILTTIKTIQKDNPLFNVRLKNKTWKKPLYILDSQLALPLQAHIFETTASITVFHQAIMDKNVDTVTLSHRRACLMQHGVRCVEMPPVSTGLDLAAILDFIAQVDGQHDLWVEAGGRCFAAFNHAQLLQRALVYIAPICLGSMAQSALLENGIGKNLKWYQWLNQMPDIICEFLDESFIIETIL